MHRIIAFVLLLGALGYSIAGALLGETGNQFFLLGAALLFTSGVFVYFFVYFFGGKLGGEL